MLLGLGFNFRSHVAAVGVLGIRPGSGAGVLSMAPAQSKTTSAESESKSRQKALAASFKRENAKNRFLTLYGRKMHN